MSHTQTQPAVSTLATALSALPGAPMIRAIWQYRGFILGMVAREFRARYLNSLFGALWAVLAPLAMIVIYTVVFSQLMHARLPGVDDSLAYGLYLCAGILPWTCFTELITRSETVFLDHSNLLKKVSFPRSTLPVILLLSTTLNFAMGFAVFLVVLLITGRWPGWPLLGYLPLLALQQGFALGLGICLGTLNVFFRDVAQLVTIALQFWFWFTPIVYSVALLPPSAQSLFALNPMTQLMNGYQQIVLRGQWPVWNVFPLHAAGALIALALAVVMTYKLSGEMMDEL